VWRRQLVQDLADGVSVVERRGRPAVLRAARPEAALLEDADRRDVVRDDVREERSTRDLADERRR
jgi:hypothetical protein